MNKIVLTMIAIIVILTAIVVGMNIYQKQETANLSNETQEQFIVAEVGNEEIYDDCTDEMEYMENEETKTLQVNSNYKKEDEEKYILRDDNGLITVYKINKDGEEEEYDATDISTEYLTKEDQESLKNGITVLGLENMNQLLEDFE